MLTSYMATHGGQRPGRRILSDPRTRCSGLSLLDLIRRRKTSGWRRGLCSTGRSAFRHHGKNSKVLSEKLRSFLKRRGKFSKKDEASCQKRENFLSFSLTGTRVPFIGSLPPFPIPRSCKDSSNRKEFEKYPFFTVGFLSPS